MPEDQILPSGLAERSAFCPLANNDMRISPFPVLLAALAIGTIWAGQDASARFNRCTESQSLAHCRLVFYGR